MQRPPLPTGRLHSRAAGHRARIGPSLPFLATPGPPRLTHHSSANHAAPRGKPSLVGPAPRRRAIAQVRAAIEPRLGVGTRGRSDVRRLRGGAVLGQARASKGLPLPRVQEVRFRPRCAPWGRPPMRNARAAGSRKQRVGRGATRFGAAAPPPAARRARRGAHEAVGILEARCSTAGSEFRGSGRLRGSRGRCRLARNDRGPASLSSTSSTKPPCFRLRAGRAAPHRIAVPRVRLRPASSWDTSRATAFARPLRPSLSA